MGARTDRADDLVRLSRGKDELHELGRLLDDLQEGIEALRRDHVGLVDDVDLVTRQCRPVRRSLTQVARVVDTPMASRVDLDDVNTAGTVTSQRDAGGAHTARNRRRPLLAVEATSQDPGRGRLAAATWPTKQIRVADPAGPQCLHQGLSDVTLTDDVGKGLRPVAAIQRCAHAPNLVGSSVLSSQARRAVRPVDKLTPPNRAA